MITKHLKFPFHFNEEKLVNDLSLLLESKWIPHFNTAGYNGEWNVIPLYANKGNESNIFAHSLTETTVTETPIIKNCHYFKEVINYFKFPLLSVRILKLGVGAKIKPHRDYKLGYEDGNFRLHIPITTNKDVAFILDGKQLTMLPGECWYTNVNYIHSVANNGKKSRVHLVIDGKRNQWSDDLFFSLAAKKSFLEIQKKEESAETIKKMIKELERSKLPKSKELIMELQKKLILP